MKICSSLYKCNLILRTDYWSTSWQTTAVMARVAQNTFVCFIFVSLRFTSNQCACLKRKTFACARSLQIESYKNVLCQTWVWVNWSVYKARKCMVICSIFCYVNYLSSVCIHLSARTGVVRCREVQNSVRTVHLSFPCKARWCVYATGLHFSIICLLWMLYSRCYISYCRIYTETGANNCKSIPVSSIK